VVELQLSGATLRLLPERAAYWLEERLLLVADVHLGKAHSFRRLGVPVPEATTTGTLARLTRALQRSGARRLVVLGDLQHSAGGRGHATIDAVGRWRRAHAAIEMTLVRGNHDARAGDPPAEWGIGIVHEPWSVGTLALRHEPQAEAGRYVLAGHLHPAVHLHGRGPGGVRLPCFHFGAAVGVLPAFGEFTGSVGVRAAAGDRVFAIADDEVREVPALHCPAS
jgi:DNA ligase-associated metallophosphoesterase